MSYVTLARGENAILKRNLLQSDGTTLTVASVTSIAVNLTHSGYLVKSYTYSPTTTSAFRSGDNGGQVLLEITPTVSASMPVGKIVAEYVVTVPDAAFLDGSSQVDRIYEHVLTMT